MKKSRADILEYVENKSVENIACSKIDPELLNDIRLNAVCVTKAAPAFWRASPRFPTSSLMKKPNTANSPAPGF